MSSRLASGSKVLEPYLPRLLIHWIAETPQATYREIDGSLALVDVSGFTKLSERLARRGKIGAEDLSDAIGACFSRLLAVAYANGGSLVKFGGDALLLWFSGEDHAGKACRAGVGMRRSLREIGRIETPAGRIALRMSVGIHSGAFHFFVVGGSHRELLVTGPAATRVVAMESKAEAGEIVVSEATAAALPHRVLGRPKSPGILLAREPRGLPLESAVPEPPVDTARLVESVPVAVRDHLVAGQAEAEHRRVTVAFVHFEGTDGLIERSGPEAAARALDGMVRAVQQAVDEGGVSFLGTDVDRDGGKIILAAGAPVASGEDDERMLLSLRALVERSLPLPVRIGVNRGNVFVGDIGPAYRRTYTVMGDAVNLAARLMAAAEEGQILATDGVVQGSRAAFEVVPLSPFHVKGKARPVQAYTVGSRIGMKDAVPDARLLLVGREREMDLLLGALDAARHGVGSVVEIIGEAGIGKSRLLQELRGRAPGTALVSAVCDLYESSTPYVPFRSVLRQALGIREGEAEEAATRRLRQVIREAAPDLLPWLPLVGIPLGLEVGPTPQTEQLEERFRRPKLEEVVERLLSILLARPTLMTIEDAHWMDEASADLLARLVSAAPDLPWLVCVTRRDVATGFVPRPDSRVTSLRPEPLDPGQATELVNAGTDEAPLAPHEIDALIKRSGGNPLFLRELMAVARGTRTVAELPSSVEAAITARIDRLPARERTVLRRAAVLGASFAEDLLEAVFPEDASRPDEEVWTGLRDFIVRDPRGTFEFRHMLVRDAAYEGLPYRIRRDLHARVAARIERAAYPNLADHAGLLAHHFFEAGRYGSAWLHARVAGKRAQEIYANVEAADFYERSLVAARHVADVPDVMLTDLYEALGDVRERLGEYRAAAAAYRAARKLVARDPVAEARLLLKQGWIPDRTGRFTEALRWIGRGLRRLEGVGGDAAARQRAQLRVWYAAVRQAQGRYREAIEWSRRAIEEAEASGELDALAHAYYLLDSVLVYLGRRDEATHSDRALEIYEELGDLSGQATVLSNSAGFAFWEGRWDDALERYGRAADAWTRAGDQVNAAVPQAGIAEILLERGRLEEAKALLNAAHRVWRAAGHRSTIAYATLNFGRLAARAGELEEARSLLHQARAEFQDVGATDLVLEADARLAETAMLEGRGAEALDLVMDALRRAGSEDGSTTHTPLLHRIRGYALMQIGETAGAREALKRSLTLARERDAPHEAAFTLRALLGLDVLEGHEPDGELRSEAEAIFQRLGIVSVSAVPLTARAALDPSA